MDDDRLICSSMVANRLYYYDMTAKCEIFKAFFEWIASYTS